jgi:putative DNA primase/helicase
MIDFNNSAPQRPPKDDGNPVKLKSSNPQLDFREKMLEHGFNPPGNIIPHGSNGNAFERFDIDKKGDLAGWYIYFEGDICNGQFGNWKIDSTIKWCSVDVSTLTYTERKDRSEKLAIAAEARKREKRRIDDIGKKKAQELWEKAEPATADFPYLKTKDIQPHGLRISRGRKAKGEPVEDFLMVPCWDEFGELWSYRRIWADGTKKNQPAARADKLFFQFPGKAGSDKLYLCEGFATGATINELTGQMVICALDTGNMPKVAKIIKRNLPQFHVIIAADQEMDKFPCPGLVAGKKAQEVLPKADMIWPEFDNYAPEKGKSAPSDFNDLAARDGSGEALKQLLSFGGQKYNIPFVSDKATSLKGWLKKRPPNREYVLNCYGVGWMPKNVVGVISATGGTGKTFMLMALSKAMATGGSFGPIDANRKLKVLCVFGEDDQEELGRRYWDIFKGKDLPENLHVVSVYGGVGPLMQLDEKRNPEEAAGYYWLQEVLKRHPGLDVLIIDPKSRFYGLDENNNDHATRWVQCIESLAMEVGGLNILLTSHTSEANAGTVSQAMNRGASGFVDACRWQAGMAQLDGKTADKWGIEPEDCWQYVTFNTPKNNYAPRGHLPMIFKRGDNGALEHVKLKNSKHENMAGKLYELLSNDPIQYSIRDLRQEKLGADICQDMKANFSSFSRSKDMPEIIKFMIQNDMAKEVNVGTATNKKDVIEVIKYA